MALRGFLSRLHSAASATEETPPAGRRSPRTPHRSPLRNVLALTASLAMVATTVAAAQAAPSARARDDSAGAAAPAVATSPTPVPHITGPLAVTSTSYPFGAAAHQRVPQDLSRYGYVEEEYVVSGKANVYDWPKPGPAVVRTPDAPYTTRVLIRRPANRKNFSGNVVVEMLNPSNLFDLNIGWGLSHNQFLRNGDAWVGITAKPISIDALKNFDPKRYEALSMANPLPLSDPRNCTDIHTLIAGDSSRTTENGLVWDINSQVGKWLRSRGDANPLTYGMGGGRATPVRHLYAFGYSQTGGMLYTYVNAIAPLDVRRNGTPIFDGYIIGVAGGAFAGTVPINQCAPNIGVDDPRNSISNAGVPVIHIMSQSDYLLGIDSRRRDSDVKGDRFRHYEVPGMAHATPDELYYSAAPEDIVKADRTIPSMTCDQGPRSRFRSALVFDAAFRNLDRWVTDDVAPPHARRIKVKDGKGVVDRFGNLVGGYRTPYVDVPTSTWTGSSTGAGFCFIVGHEEPFSQARLERLYPTHADYVRQVTQDVQDLVSHNFLTRADGQQVIEAARFSDIPSFPSYRIDFS